MIAMLQALDHITLRSTNLARTLEFYRQVLGMEPGPRPAFHIPGLWLCIGGQPVLHVLEMPIEGRGGAIDHVAFQAFGRAAIAARLNAADVPFQLAALPDGSALQMFVCDPDGARIELVFRRPEDR